MRVRLDRTLPIALTEQIKGQIVYGVATGQLTAGERMSSVRELAAQLSVAPMTIAQVYRELAKQGIVVTKQGSGTFVADVAGLGLDSALGGPRNNLYQMVEAWLQQAMLQGYALDDVRNAFLERIAESTSMEARCLWMVGNFRPATEAYAREIEGILASAHVRVRPVLLSDLCADLAVFTAEVPHVRLVITIPTRHAEVHSLLEPYGCRVVAVAFRVSPETRQRLASIRPDERVGIISTYGEFLPTMVEEVGLYCPPGRPPHCAVLGQHEHIAALLANVDVVIYASGSEAILERLPERVRAIELRHAPEPDSVNRLRLLVA
jgi:DNA-binding transcriptional regulator YhcF (GntR family)